jgi:hypothetical protein
VSNSSEEGSTGLPVLVIYRFSARNPFLLLLHYNYILVQQPHKQTIVLYSNALRSRTFPSGEKEETKSFGGQEEILMTRLLTESTLSSLIATAFPRGVGMMVDRGRLSV